MVAPFEFLSVIAAVSPFHSMCPFHNGDGGLSGTVSPISKRQAFWLLDLIAAVAAVAAATQLRMLRALVGQAVRDPLTECLRRHGGSELLEQQFRYAARHGTPLTVLFADIDRFKHVNDRHGHEAGDRVLVGVAQALRKALRQSDVLVRWGGEEFVALLPRADASAARALIERLRTQGFGATPDGEPVTLSIGIASHPEDGAASATDLVALADQRMYAAKHAGRDAYVGARAKPQWILRPRALGPVAPA